MIGDEVADALRERMPRGRRRDEQLGVAAKPCGVFARGRSAPDAVEREELLACAEVVGEREAAARAQKGGEAGEGQAAHGMQQEQAVGAVERRHFDLCRCVQAHASLARQGHQLGDPVPGRRGRIIVAPRRRLRACRRRGAQEREGEPAAREGAAIL